MVLPTITKKQQEILLLLYRFRFLNRVQIQTLLQHKTFNRVIAWLNDLTEKNYIGKLVNTTLTINTTPTIYFLKANGLRFLKSLDSCEKKYLYRMYSEEKKSNEFIEQNILITDIYNELMKKYGDTKSFSFFTRSDFTVEGIIKEIFPHFVYMKDRNEFYIVEFLKERPRFSIRSRIEQYINFFSNGNGKVRAPMSKLLFVCPNNTIEDIAHKHAKKTLEKTSEVFRIFTSTKEQVLKNGIDGQIGRQVE